MIYNTTESLHSRLVLYKQSSDVSLALVLGSLPVLKDRSSSPWPRLKDLSQVLGLEAQVFGLESRVLNGFGLEPQVLVNITEAISE